VTARRPVAEVASDDPHMDDWDRHWTGLGDTAENSPANLLRRRLVTRLLGRMPGGVTLLDIGSGQGELAIHLQRENPDVSVVGVEHSAAGIGRSRVAAARAAVPARFVQMDLLTSVHLPHGQQAAAFAVCSEVLEHVDAPAALLRNAAALAVPGCRLIVTVPGGARTAFDRHIGHREHYSTGRLRSVVEEGGWQVDRVLAAGFPFFNLYKLLILVRGERMVSDVVRRAPGSSSSRAERLASSAFRTLFRLTTDSTPWGWQVVALAHLPTERS
jgi:SAM-dependent methyltransferase